MLDAIRIRDLFDCRVPYLRPLLEACEYPWELLPRLRVYIEQLLGDGIEGFTPLCDGVLVGKDVRIHPSAVIEAPAVIGGHTELRPGAYVRGNVITGEGCVIGNSTEVKGAILLDRVQIPHYNYVGDSILGGGAHLGAGAVCSNLKADGKEVVVHAARDYETGLRKLGGILGDGADVGCGCVLNPGTVIGKGTSVYPLTSLRGVYPSGCIVKDAHTVISRR